MSEHWCFVYVKVGASAAFNLPRCRFRAWATESATPTSDGSRFGIPRSRSAFGSVLRESPGQPPPARRPRRLRPAKQNAYAICARVSATCCGHHVTQLFTSCSTSRVSPGTVWKRSRETYMVHSSRIRLGSGVGSVDAGRIPTRYSIRSTSEPTGKHHPREGHRYQSTDRVC